MKQITYRDTNGMLHRSLLRDDMPESMAERGIPADPPDIINGLDWEKLKTDLHNALVEDGLVNLSDLQNNNRIASAILRTFQRPLVNLYKQKEMTKKDLGGTHE